MNSQIERFKAIATILRQYTGFTEKITANDFVPYIGFVYEAGKSQANKTPTYKLNKLTYSTFENVVFPEDTELTVETNSVSSLTSEFLLTTNLKKLTLKSNNKDNVIAADGAFRESQLVIVDLTNFNRKFNNINFIIYNSDVRTVLGSLDVSECTSIHSNTFRASSLANISFVPSTIKCDVTFEYTQQLSTASIKSIIDGLAALEEGVQRTLTFSKATDLHLSPEDRAKITQKGWSYATI